MLYHHSACLASAEMPISHPSRSRDATRTLASVRVYMNVLSTSCRSSITM